MKKKIKKITVELNLPLVADFIQSLLPKIQDTMAQGYITSFAVICTIAKVNLDIVREGLKKDHLSLSIQPHLEDIQEMSDWCIRKIIDIGFQVDELALIENLPILKSFSIEKEKE